MADEKDGRKNSDGTLKKVAERSVTRRHDSTGPHLAAVGVYRAAHGPEARRMRAKERELASAARTPESRIAELDRRLGVGIGARRERARLLAATSAAKA
ncbi:MAG: hypothetical protein A2934_00125 [Candidatus Sungbacteria bacterium RIFCSPLOWO2_01_FULL_47_10]|uniref:Uncharacterized protein n=1 Tax=Candidatus Sungbacteria bacterium RIFCSPLOWO2_01_FULL_47_10 TaxID=1802276 RepID=A0A1G2L6Q2_9BACT|nr:MAG: hypothetical protein A2934_00125 [Candidatus Sungbacteria bacterium RIFCSPLOWO2_01_FULL_47_10]